MQVLNDANFDAFIEANEIVFVDFWASWCAPCKTFGVIFEAVSERYPTIQFAKVNVEESTQLATMFEIQSIPYLMVFKSGILIYANAGSLPENMLEELVQQAQDADVSMLSKDA
jgi:thioredoxin 1